jgi:hypothetical protein
MLRPFKYIMKVFYANENYAKYGVRGMNYFMALVGTAFYIMMTCFTILFIISASSPSHYRSWRSMHSGIPDWVQASLFLGIVCLILKSIFKKESLENDILGRKEVNKAINYLLLYMFALAILIVFLGLHYLRYYN